MYSKHYYIQNIFYLIFDIFFDKDSIHRIPIFQSNKYVCMYLYALLIVTMDSV